MTKDILLSLDFTNKFPREISLSRLVMLLQLFKELLFNVDLVSPQTQVSLPAYPRIFFFGTPKLLTFYLPSKNFEIIFSGSLLFIYPLYPAGTLSLL
ncbi:MAG: hypothetical protein U0X39_00685 [Bacteroidales bacterium]